MIIPQQKRGFRSRGICLLRQDGDAPHRQKCYYDAGDSLYPAYLQQYIADGLLHPFEYSLNQFGVLDSINFHVETERDLSPLYEGISEEPRRIIGAIPRIFSQNFRLYTIGYRMLGEDIIGKTFYFYPTIRKENRVGIKGIEDSGLIGNFCDRFLQFLQMPSESWEEIEHYVKLVAKFKGVSLTVLRNGAVDYKFYGRIPSSKIYQYLQNYLYSDITQYQRFGDVILTAVRFNERAVMGYNLYYLL